MFQHVPVTIVSLSNVKQYNGHQYLGTKSGRARLGVPRTPGLVTVSIYIWYVVILTIIRIPKPRDLSLHKFVKYFWPSIVFNVFKKCFKFWWLE